MNKKFWASFLLLSALNLGYMVYAEAAVTPYKTFSCLPR